MFERKSWRCCGTGVPSSQLRNGGASPWMAAMLGLVIIDAASIWTIWWRRQSAGSFADALWVTHGLWIPAGAVLGFIVAATIVRKMSSDARVAGQTLMLMGLLWLIVYDAAIVAGYIDWLAAALVLLLLPTAYISVQVMRWWSKLMAASGPMEYQRAR